jgi:hypothetical protein
MRILFWSETFWPRVGGVENLAARLLPALQVRGHEFLSVGAIDPFDPRGPSCRARRPKVHIDVTGTRISSRKIGDCYQRSTRLRSGDGVWLCHLKVERDSRAWLRYIFLNFIRFRKTIAGGDRGLQNGRT